jgi:geranylgeranyl diphosphate synthase type II
MEAENHEATPRELLFIHRGKTAAMIAASLRLGAMSANATPVQIKALGKFGENLGLAFQIVDDILDITQTSDQLGKSAGKDASSGKATYPAVFGLEKSRREATRLTNAALKALDPLGPKADFLRAIAADMLGRQH